MDSFLDLAVQKSSGTDPTHSFNPRTSFIDTPLKKETVPSQSQEQIKRLASKEKNSLIYLFIRLKMRISGGIPLDTKLTGLFVLALTITLNAFEEPPLKYKERSLKIFPSLFFISLLTLAFQNCAQQPNPLQLSLENSKNIDDISVPELNTVDIFTDQTDMDSYTTKYFDDGSIEGSGATWVKTGLVDTALSGSGLNANGYLYNGAGFQYRPGEKSLSLAQLGASEGEDATLVFSWVVAAAKNSLFDRVTISKKYFVSNPILIYGVSKLSLIGLEGGGVHRSTETTAANLIQIVGSNRIEIASLKLSSDYSGAIDSSTGSNPVIEISSSPGTVNSSIHIHDCVIENGNIAGILIDGRYELDEDTVAISNIVIERNKISGAGDGVFAYKSGRDLQVIDNIIFNAGGGGLTLDTQAAGSDPDTGRYKIENVVFSGNQIFDSTAPPGIQPRGITLKGGLFNILVKENSIVGIHSTENLPNMGILLIKDDVGYTGSKIKIVDNIVKNISNSVGEAAWAALVGEGFTEVLISGNIFENSQRGLKISAGSEVTFEQNTLINVAYEYEYRIFISSSLVDIGESKVEISTNTFMGIQRVGEIGVVESGVTNVVETGNIHPGLNSLYFYP